MEYYSQYRQDRFIDYFYSGKENGFFLDIGAHDGLTYSNSVFFERQRDWKGICIEPIPDVFNKLARNRNCICINCAVSEKSEKLAFRRIHGYAEILSWILEFMDADHLGRIEHETRSSGGPL